ncbi:hypothetical protein AGMMS50256_33960 [Betaproteobacteria bacterium]|nr:hypothetical protein AGMMS50256_33960 [Betaproteobacteria bacterium]
MTRLHSPLQQLKEARQIALDYGCFIVEKHGQRGLIWILYRKHPNPEQRAIYIGKCSSPAAIRRFVEKVCIPEDRRRKTEDSQLPGATCPQELLSSVLSPLSSGRRMA